MPDYFDTSFLVPLIIKERASAAVDRFMRNRREGASLASQWTRVEFASAAAREARMGRLDPVTATAAIMRFDRLLASSFETRSCEPADFQLACEYLHVFGSGLRAGDALHLAVAANAGAGAIYSLDKTMITAGAILALPVKRGIPD